MSTVPTIDVDEPASVDEQLQATIAAEQQACVDRLLAIAREARQIERRMGVLGQMAELACELEQGAPIEEAATAAPAAHQRIESRPPQAPQLAAVPDPDPEPMDDVDVDQHVDEDSIIAEGYDELAPEPAASIEQVAAGVTVTVTPPRAAGGSSARHAAIVAEVEAYVRARPGTEFGSSKVATALGRSGGTIARAMGELLEAGVLEHNGKGGAWSRYTLADRSGPSASNDVEKTEQADERPPPAPGPSAEAERERRAQADADQLAAVAARQTQRGIHTPPAMSARTRRALRDERTTGRREPPELMADGQGTVQGAVLSLLGHNEGLSAGALAARLGLSGHQVARALRSLARDGDVRTSSSPNQNPADTVWVTI